MRNNFWKKINRPILALAPMAGITDSTFRSVCKKNGADVTYSEMASVSALYFKPKKTLELVRFGKEEKPYIVQLFGKDPSHFSKAARIVTESVKPDGIDINFGCPAKKVFGHGSGCALMPQRKLAREIIAAVCENTQLPVSIKIRAGVKGMSALDFIKNTADIPYSAVMVHGRTFEGSFSGAVDFQLIESIKKIFPEKIVLANGGIYAPEDAVEILKKYPSIDGLGIARGSWGQPFIFNQIKELLKNGHYQEYDARKIRKIMIEHAEIIEKDKGKLGLFEIRKHMAWYIKGFPGASHLRSRLVVAKSLEEIREILNVFKCE